MTGAGEWPFARPGPHRVIHDLLARADRPRHPEAALHRIQAAEPEAVIVVSPETRDRLRDDPSFNDDRIVSW